jgi:hypothetical protein
VWRVAAGSHGAAIYFVIFFQDCGGNKQQGPKISVWSYVSKQADAQAFQGALVGDHGPRLTVVAFLSGRGN